LNSVPRQGCRNATRSLMAGITSRRTCKTPEKRLLNVKNLDVLYTAKSLSGHREPFLICLKSVFPDRVETPADKGVNRAIAPPYNNCNDKRQHRACSNERDHNA